MTQEDITHGAVQTAEELGCLACARRKLLRLTLEMAFEFASLDSRLLS
jgi:hypothetical protein